MDCPICEYRRIAREALYALAEAHAQWAPQGVVAFTPECAELWKLWAEFRAAYRAEQAAAA